MRIPSGVTDQYVYFVGVDATDLKTRELGLTGFTVYRSRNGAAAAAMTTPTVNETDATNMPGVYELLLDEDTTIAAGNDSEEMCLHITASGMAPVTRVIELYRPKITAGNTLGVASDGDISGNLDGTVATVTTLTGHTAQTGDSYARIGANGAGLSAVPWNSSWDTEVQSECNDALVANGLDHLMAAAVTGADVTDNSVIAQLAASGATADWDTFDNAADSLQAISESGGGGPTAGQIADAVWDEDIVAAHGTGDTAGLIVSQLTSRSVTFNTAVDDASILGQMADDGTASYDRATDSLQAIADSGGGGPTAAQIADAVWDEATAGHTTGGTFGEQVKTDLDAILVDTDELQGDWANGGRLDNILDARASQASVDTVDGNVDLVLADTGELQTDWANGGRLDAILDARASQASVDGLNDIAATDIVSAGAITTSGGAVSTVTSVTNEVSADVTKISGSAPAADNLEASTLGIISGTAQTGTLTTTVMTTDITGYADDELIGRVIVWTGGTAAGQATDITDFAATNGTLTYTAVTTAPVNGDSFVVV